MPNPKIKLHKKTGKLKSIRGNGNQPQSSVVTNEAPASTSSSILLTSARDSQTNLQFESELYWCIQQLEESLRSGKHNERQVHDIEKTLRILKSDKQNIIKKRQVMNSTFGDYRAKMLQEEKKLSLKSKEIKFQPNIANGQKSFFIKKSAFLKSGKDFKFNFSMDQASITDDNNDEPTISSKQIQNSFNFKIEPSDNSFKFNFNNDGIVES